MRGLMVWFLVVFVFGSIIAAIIFVLNRLAAALYRDSVRDSRII